MHQLQNMCVDQLFWMSGVLNAAEVLRRGKKTKRHLIDFFMDQIRAVDVATFDDQVVEFGRITRKAAALTGKNINHRAGVFSGVGHDPSGDQALTHHRRCCQPQDPLNAAVVFVELGNEIVVMATDKLCFFICRVTRGSDVKAVRASAQQLGVQDVLKLDDRLTERRNAAVHLAGGGRKTAALNHAGEDHPVTDQAVGF